MPRKQLTRIIDPTIHVLRGQRVMLDSELATIYEVTTKRLNEQLRRNRYRFPNDFAFQLTRQEFMNLKSQIATSSLHGGRRKLPWVFTEHGATCRMGSRPVSRKIEDRKSKIKNP